MTTCPAFTRRPARPDDLTFAWALYRELMKPLTEELLAWQDASQQAVVARDLASGGAEIIVMEGVDIGWLHLREADGRLELGQLYIAPDFQNRGIGTALVEQIKARAVRTAMTLELQVMINNRAQSLYRRLGFQKVETGATKIILRYEPASGGRRSLTRDD